MKGNQGQIRFRNCAVRGELKIYPTKEKMKEFVALWLGDPRRMDDTVTPNQLHTKSKKTVMVAQERV
jgi:hypothetical protein